MGKKSKRFWEKWYEANELERVALVKTLTLPSKIDDDVLFKHQCAVLINSYLCDLSDWCGVEALGGKG